VSNKHKHTYTAHTYTKNEDIRQTSDNIENNSAMQEQRQTDRLYIKRVLTHVHCLFL